jgi:hypothetical protein
LNIDGLAGTKEMAPLEPAGAANANEAEKKPSQREQLYEFSREIKAEQKARVAEKIVRHKSDVEL